MVYLQEFEGQEQKRYSIDEIRYRSDSGRVLECVNELSPLTEQKIADLKKIWDTRAGSWDPLDRSGVWRYREFLPALAPFDSVVTMPEGNTPVYSMQRCAAYTGMETLHAKHQGMNPTGSFKDNGMTCAVSMAKKLGASMVACASTGNTSASMAAYATRAGMKSVIFIPDGQIAYGKLSQALDFGGHTIQISGDFDMAMKIVEEVCIRENIYLLNSINPFRIEGQKTIMIELLHQLNWEIPDWVVVPGGNLGNNSAFGKAFEELKRVGLISKVPRIAVIQAEGANPLYQSWKKEEQVLTPVEAQTRATAIKIGNPVSFDKSWFALRSTNGVAEEVSEAEIAQAKVHIGYDGVGSEPASATTVAGVKKLVQKGVITPQERVVCILTGHLLKDPDYTIEYHQDELYADPQRTTAVTGHEKIETGPYRNMPVQLPADSDVIIQHLQNL
ncbi:threonine synthase [Chitinivibrio alkaliphilus]|uniref:Threonine synthase n=1 Tax=Chitinivibrio alkaliphilus ACht1 TaxID=1313304 RepID=U7D7R2_9BACT|nr:threonine synthase [Chitinivibrio alkaliphilus]ERP31132.1 threonine synthase [Chitinivibrio alkaliphilus ACht1]